MVPPRQSAVLSRRSLLQGIAAFSTTVLFAGCGGGASGAPAAGSSATETLADPQPSPAGAATQASLNISSVSSGNLGAGFVGLSYEKSALSEPLFTVSNAELIGLFKLLGPSVLRIGGNSVDQFVWTPGGPGREWGQVAPSDVAALADFVKAAGWQCIYGINLGGAATGATTPAMAAAEVAYAAEQFGSSLLGIEIGNECDGYGGSSSYFAGNWSLAQFETLWEQFRTAILDATPGVSITGPASAGNVSTWTVPFGQNMTSRKVSLLTQHYYRGNGQSAGATAAKLLTPDSTLANYLGALKPGAGSVGVPYRMGECNSFYEGGAPGVSNAYASSLWVLDFLFNCALGGASGVNLHGGGNSAGYTPIADSNGAVVEARPIFYGMTLFAQAGQGELYPASVSPPTQCHRLRGALLQWSHESNRRQQRRYPRSAADRKPAPAGRQCHPHHHDPALERRQWTQPGSHFGRHHSGRRNQPRRQLRSRRRLQSFHRWIDDFVLRPGPQRCSCPDPAIGLRNRDSGRSAQIEYGPRVLHGRPGWKHRRLLQSARGAWPRSASCPYARDR